ncbi:hypothetical protein D4764_20G0007440 [Takifugu flavidus]|uniref:Uncharacterized protein n=1 Tax=Takifugu flavidus TaxID=433684 RepID=A0A5C6NGN4_9TELE|nr:hypothetical protein D4764_20G0007440 [Takifugu flavidus]
MTRRGHMVKYGRRAELVERGNGAEGLAPPVAKFCFLPFRSLWGWQRIGGCQKPLPRCTEGSRQGGISQCPSDRLLLGVGGGGGKECISDRLCWSGSGHQGLVKEVEVGTAVTNKTEKQEMGRGAGGGGGRRDGFCSTSIEVGGGGRRWMKITRRGTEEKKDNTADQSKTLSSTIPCGSASLGPTLLRQESVKCQRWASGYMGLLLSTSLPTCGLSGQLLLPGDFICQPQSPRFFSQVPYGQPSLHSISRAWAVSRSGLDHSPPGRPLAVPQGMSCPLPAAHPGSEDATAAAYLNLAANSCSLQFEANIKMCTCAET